MDTKARKSLSDVQTKLVLHYTFFATLSLSKNFVEEKRIPTMATDGMKVYYNPKFVNSLTLPELTGVVVHEMYHILLMHMLRLGNRNPMIANVAMDYAINPLVLEAGFTLPKDVLLDNRFNNMEWEKIYSILLKESPKITIKMGGTEGEGGNGSFKGDIGSVQSPKNEDGSALSSGDMKKLEQDIKQQIQGAYQASKKIGNLPANLERLVKELLEPVINWKAAMQEFVVINSRNDYSWTKPNRRYIQSGFILPSLEKPEIGDIVVGIDTSGSMSEKDLREVASELQCILQTFNTRIIVVYWDTRAYDPVEFDSDNPIVQLKMIGGGGTDVSSFFKMVEKNQYDPVAYIIFTDGYVGNTFPKKAPDCKVLWILNQKNNNFANPFGEVIHISREEEE